MRVNRRSFMKTAGLGMVAFGSVIPSKRAWAGQGGAVGIGMCDWNLGEPADPEVIPKAREANLQGIQVSIGDSPAHIPLRSASVRKKYLDMGQKYNIVFHSIAAGGILNELPLASEPQSAVYVIDAIEAAKALGAKNILAAFFGNGDLRKKDKDGKFIDRKDGSFSSFELDAIGVKRVIEALRQIVPRAEEADVVIGLENTLTAKQNLEIIDKIGSKMVQVYYDVGNSTAYGYDVPAEIRLIGNDRLCEVHLKDWKTPMLGSSDGQVNMQKAAEALTEIGFNKWYVLETSGRKDQFIQDTHTNVEFVHKTFRFA
jgi:L-ribulose-5-phosphate 3-epimerase